MEHVLRREKENADQRVGKSVMVQRETKKKAGGGCIRQGMEAER